MELTTVGVVAGARFGVPMPQGSMLIEAGGAMLRVVNPVAGETVRLALSASDPASVAGLVAHGRARVEVTVDGVAGSLAADLVASARMAPGVVLTGYLAAGAAGAGQAVAVMAVSLGGVDYLVATRPAGSGIELFRIGADLGLTRVAGLADSAATAAAGVSALAMAELAGRVVIYAGSGTEHGITAYEVAEGGALRVLGTVGQAEGVPMQGLTALKAVAMGGRDWLIAGAAGSSSLSVFAIGADGTLQGVDHVIDDLPTRFGNLTAMDAVAVNGRVFVVAAGADDGLSLLTLMPDGALVHLVRLADTDATALANVTELRLAVVGGVLQVFALSGAEAGLTQLSVDLRSLGAVGQAGTGGDDLLFAGGGGVALSGGAGRDILTDGAGSDTLTGGAGADLFVPVADGARDMIADFDIAQDRIDLSRWQFFRNAGQLTITPTATGAVLRYWAEELELRSVTGKPFSEAALRGLVYTSLSRLALGEAPLVGPPPPDPGISGSAGNDTLEGTAAGEVISGLAGDDLIRSGGGRDTVYGGAGTDWLDFGDAGEALRLDLARWANGSADAVRLRVSDVEGYLGTGWGDVMLGARAAVLFRGGAGNDTLTAGAGGGAIWGEAGEDSLTGGAGADRLYGGEGADVLEGGEGNDTLEGGLGHDRLFGGAGENLLDGGEGNDTLTGGAGMDRLSGGAGEDSLAGGAGNDTLDGGAGRDALWGGEGEDRLAGGDEADALAGEAGQDTLAGGEGDDTLSGGAGNDSLSGEAGQDVLAGGAGSDALRGGAGNDLLQGGGLGNDTLLGEEGADSLTGAEGRDALYGGAGADSLAAGGGDDLLSGEAGQDTLWGEAGNDVLNGWEDEDWLYGGAGDDRINAGSGNDALWGGTGNDLLSAGTGHDSLRGEDGNDRLAGLAGDDHLYGGAGRDTLEGGRGRDRLFGGAGADVFLFTAYPAGEVDVITDFENGLDRLRLLGIAGSSDAARFRALEIRDVVVGGVKYAEVGRFDHAIRLAGVSASELTAADFLFS